MKSFLNSILDDIKNYDFKTALADAIDAAAVDNMPAEQCDMCLHMLKAYDNSRNYIIKSNTGVDVRAWVDYRGFVQCDNMPAGYDGLAYWDYLSDIVDFAKEFNYYDIEFASFVLIDADTGEILAAYDDDPSFCDFYRFEIGSDNAIKFCAEYDCGEWSIEGHDIEAPYCWNDLLTAAMDLYPDAIDISSFYIKDSLNDEIVALPNEYSFFPF